jgi:Flp pilus assembly protein CpaB
MSRRMRAAAFLLLALAAAATAGGIANGYGSSVASGYGPLRPVVVAVRDLEAGEPLRADTALAALALRRVPVRFAPPGALATPASAIGLAPAVTVPAGSYVLAVQLRPPRRAAMGARLSERRHPVEIAVSGAGALLAAGAARGAKVDVIVTTEPSGAGPGRTYVAAAAVPLLGIGPGADGPGPGGTEVATLGLTRAQALRLIAAESFARKLTLLPGG